jgi:uncharacterized membrane protein HdeD (DUF308 family)
MDRSSLRPSRPSVGPARAILSDGPAEKRRTVVRTPLPGGARSGHLALMTSTRAGVPVPDPIREVSSYWWLSLVAGIAWIVIALVILQFDKASITTVGVLIGLMFLLAAAQNFTFGALARGFTRWFLWIFGVLFLAAGVVSLVQPEETFAGVADILGFLFLIVGVFWMVEAFTEREVNDLWWFGLIGGISLIILAFWTSGQFFIEKQYVLLVFAGIWALFQGTGDIIRAFQMRRVEKAVT